MRVFSTFSWVWWFELWITKALWKIYLVWYSEIDKFANEVYKFHFCNWKDIWLNYWDITKIDINSLPYIECLTGWFPCQDVSVAWKQNLQNWRTVLVEYLLRILEIKKPKYFVFENVKGLLSKKFETFFTSICERIERAWYTYTYQVLNTKHYWLPQNRERVFIVWKHKDYGELEFEFPKREELALSLQDIIEGDVDEKYYVSQELIDKLKKTYAQNARIYEHLAPTLWTMQWWHQQPKILQRARGFNNGGIHNIVPTISKNSWQENNFLTICEQRFDEWLRFFKDNMSWALRTIDTCWHKRVIWKNILRKITPLECERLQWFPDNWTLVPYWKGMMSNSQRYKQMGNAVSVNVIEKIFLSLKKDICK